MKKRFITRTLLATAILFMTAATSFGQCVIPITDNQPSTTTVKVVKE